MIFYPTSPSNVQAVAYSSIESVDLLLLNHCIMGADTAEQKSFHQYLFQTSPSKR